MGTLSKVTRTRPSGSRVILVVSRPQDPVQGPGKQQQEQAGDSAVTVDGGVGEHELDAAPAGFVGHGDLERRCRSIAGV
jgi:hypothetical protein